MSVVGVVVAESVREPVRLLDFWPLCIVRRRPAGPGAYLRGMTDDRSRLWTPRALSDYTGIPLRTLADWRTVRGRSRGLGLPFVVLSSHNIRYRDEDVVAFIERRIVGSLARAGD